MREGNNFSLPHTPKGEFGLRGKNAKCSERELGVRGLFVWGLVIFALFILNFIHAPNHISAATSPDAIAIRVIPNPDHYSPLHWYQNQGFTGSPQSLTVDGYEAVRDGRTVYVNAANVDATNLYTNIYLISYNQDAESATVDIFGRILDHWKFNTNVIGTGFCSSGNGNVSDCSGTIGCWHFDGDFKDSSGNGNDGSGKGSMTFTAGKIGQAADFDGSSYVDMGNSIKPAQFTLEAWVYYQGGGWKMVIGNEDDDYSGFWLDIDENNRLYLLVGNCPLACSSSSQFYIPLNSTNPITTNNWIHVAATYDGDNMFLYINGIKDSNTANGTISYLNHANNFLIGKAADFDGHYFNGTIDEVKIYDRALSASEIQDNYNQVYSQCLVDSECSSGGYCSSPKANIIRDTKRLSELVEIKIILESYKNKSGLYPKLESGTYLPRQTISTWPSWQETLAKELGAALPLDPINKLGVCSGYDSTTCWDEQTKKFAGSLPDNLPAGSNVMIYTATSTGASYDICAVMGSGYLTSLSQGACPTSYVNISKTAFNNPPLITGVNLPIGYSGELYNGYIEASDPDGDKISWTLDTSLEPWTFWSAAPALKNIGVTNQRKITAQNAGMPGSYDFAIALDDGRGGKISQTYTITVKQSPNPPVVDPVADKTVTIGKNLSFAITASDPNNQYPLSFIFNNSPGGFAGAGSLDINQHDYNVSGLVIDQTQIYNVSVVAANKYGNPSNPIAFNITVNNNPPAITSLSSANATACVNFNYQVTTSDPDGHNVNDFSAAGLPANLSINNTTGLIGGQSQTTGAFNIIITAKDEYAAQTKLPYLAQDSQNFTLNVVDEVFSTNSPGNGSIYVWPTGIPLASLYHNSISGDSTTYFGTASVNGTTNTVTYSLLNKPSWLAINPANGQIQGTPTNNTTDPGNYAITVSATNNCGAGYSANFNIAVTKNEWCGDSIPQNGSSGTHNHGEQCDDGNVVNTDACTNSCKNAVCGDVIVWSGVEQCDDGNVVDSDACTNSCKNAVCGDGIVQVGVEQCDDNNINNNDGCSSTCAIESGWNCVGSPSVCNAICGDWLIRGTEQCDDGNAVNTDACTNSCKNAVCGDGIIRSGVEQCDDGVNNNSEGYCNSTCTGPQPPDSYGAWFGYNAGPCENDTCGVGNRTIAGSNPYTCPSGVLEINCLDVYGGCGHCSDGACQARYITCYP